jgi:hypothetical protein
MTSTRYEGLLRRSAKRSVLAKVGPLAGPRSRRALGTHHRARVIAPKVQIRSLWPGWKGRAQGAGGTHRT